MSADGLAPLSEEMERRIRLVVEGKRGMKYAREEMAALLAEVDRLRGLLHEAGVSPETRLSLDKSIASEARRLAFEEAARVCERVRARWSGEAMARDVAAHCADRIRSLQQPPGGDRG